MDLVPLFTQNGERRSYREHIGLIDLAGVLPFSIPHSSLGREAEGRMPWQLPRNLKCPSARVGTGPPVPLAVGIHRCREPQFSRLLGALNSELAVSERSGWKVSRRAERSAERQKRKD